MDLELAAGDLPAEFHERLGQLLRGMSGASIASVQPGKRPGSWVVELAFPDRAERATLIYAPDAAHELTNPAQ